ncbi:MAG TPA: hypothetical protein VIU37_13635 [Candidatus Limnocylindrales bacterium]
MTDPTAWRVAPLDLAAWGLAEVEHERTRFLGRPCLRFADTNRSLVLPDVRLEDGSIELDLAVSRERSFHGLVWRVRDEDNFESFFVRSHQVGNPDSIQYTPVNNGIPGWQLYHGPGFWAPVAFPIDAWFSIRVAFAGARADVYVGDLGAPVLRVGELKRPPAVGGIGIQIGGPGLRVARFAWTDEVPDLSDLAVAPVADRPGAIRDWEASDPFPEAEIEGLARLPVGLVAPRTWTHLTAEPSGLVDLSRVHGIRDGRNTVLVRTSVRSPADRTAPLELGFSDRATVFLNGQALFRGDDSYRSRDYRFLGSIGFWDTVYLPLRTGDNELVIAVSEDLGGWGLQACLAGGTDGLPIETIATT